MNGEDVLNDTQKLQIRRAAITELQRRGRLPNDPNLVNAPPTFFRQLSEEFQRGLKEDISRTKEAVGIGKKFVSGLKEKWPQTIGSTIGAALPAAVNLIPGAAATPEEYLTIPAGQAVGTSVTNLLGRMNLSGVGGAVGRAGQEAYRTLTGSQEAPKGLWEAVSRIGKAYEEEAIGQAIGEGLSGGLTKALSPFAKKTIPAAPRLSKQLSEAAKRIPEEELAKLPQNLRNILTAKTIMPRLYKEGDRLLFGRVPKYTTLLTPSQKTVSPTLDWIESAIEGSIFGGGKLKLQKTYLQPAGLKQLTQEAVDNLWDIAGRRMSRAQVAHSFTDAIVDSKESWRNVQRIAYSKVDDLSRNIPGKKEYKGLVSEYMEGKFAGETVKQGGGYRTVVVPFESVRKRAAQAIKDAGPGIGEQSHIITIAEKAQKIQDAESFVEAISRRSDLLDAARIVDSELGFKARKVRRVVDDLVALADNEMEKAAKSGGDEMYAAWRAANKLTKEGYEHFQSVNLTRALKFAEKNPSKVADIFFQPQAAEGVSELRNLVPDHVFKTMRATWLERQLNRASTADGILLGKNFKAALSEQAMGKDTIVAIFPDRTVYNKLMDVADLGSILQEKGATGGKMVMQLTQSGQVVMTLARAATGEKTQKGMLTSLVITPLMLGRILNSPTGSKWLAEGFTTPITSPKVSGLVAKIAKLTGGEKPITPISDWVKQRFQKRQEPTLRQLRGFGGRGY